METVAIHGSRKHGPWRRLLLVWLLAVLSVPPGLARADGLTPVTGSVDADGDGRVFTLFVNDLWGSPIVAFDENGDVVWRATSKPYGERMPQAGSPLPDLYTHPLQFLGKPQDPTGLSYLNQRHYDPAIGRFLSMDPVGIIEEQLPHSFNRYKLREQQSLPFRRSPANATRWVG